LVVNILDSVIADAVETSENRRGAGGGWGGDFIIIK
jgi:hypothetical protein